jgi:hypothetical protein
MADNLSPGMPGHRTRSFLCAALLMCGVDAHMQSSAGELPPANDHFFFDLSAVARAALATNPPPRVRHGFTTVDILARHALATTNATERTTISHEIAEVLAAIQNNDRSPVPRRIDITQLPFVHHRYISGRVGTRHSSSEPATSDGNDLDPLPSTFWTPPRQISRQNLGVGFGRNVRPDFEGPIWTYAKAKNGFGAHAGFEAQNGETRIKIKFGELHSEPFTARLFHALGYNVDPTDYSPGLKVNYDPRLFTEFNSRKPLNTKISALGVLPVWTIRFQPEHDPFQHIASAVLKDGTTLSREQLKAAMPTAALSTNLDSRIAYLLTVPANVQSENPAEETIGPWDFGQLGHENLRELRGAGLLAAWLGWFDSRFDNTRLRVVKEGHDIQLKHVFADLGGGLGKSLGWSGWSSEKPSDFPSSFTKPEIFQGRGHMTIPFRVVNFRPIESTPAFAAMTTEDARWMARLIAQLTDEQITGALRASGFDEANVEVYRRKLLSRREKMLRDLGLSQPLLQRGAADGKNIPMQ